MLNRRAFCTLAAGTSLLRAQAQSPSEIKVDELRQKCDKGYPLIYPRAK